LPDLLVRLYDLPHFEAEEKVKAAGITVRRAMAPERDVVLDWFMGEDDFPKLWRGEIALGLSQLPSTTLIAARGQELLGFACYDTSAKGFFGPTGVTVPARGQGIGEALLIATLKAMRDAGYGYAVIGDPGPVEFYRKRLDALEIPKSKPGVYAGMLRAPKSE
jgi:GNAT superfamily N-acetyltransferase